MAAEDRLQPAAGRLATPRRAELLARFAGSQARARVVLTFEIFLIVVGAAFVLVHSRRFDLLSAWTVAAGLLGLLGPILLALVGGGTPLEALQPGSRLGVHSRDSITRVVSEVRAALGLGDRRVRVFLTRDKRHNALASAWSLLPGLDLAAAIHLHRGILHLLDEDELRTVVGHELGHVGLYVPEERRWYGVHALAATALGLSLLPFLDRMGAGWLAPILGLFLVDRLISWPSRGLSPVVEYLCNDAGARAGGWLAAMSTDFKLGLEAEVSEAIHDRILEAAERGVAADVTALVAQYEEAMPFGRADPVEAKATVERLLSVEAAERRGLTLGGFVRYLQEQDRTSRGQGEEIAEARRLYRAVAALPRLAIDRRPYAAGSAGWTAERARALVEAMRGSPDQLLFVTTPEVLGETTHPSQSRSLLYLYDEFAGEPPPRRAAAGAGAEPVS